MEWNMEGEKPDTQQFLLNGYGKSNFSQMFFIMLFIGKRHISILLHNVQENKKVVKK